MTENDIGTAIIASTMRVHSVVGPGLLESAYEACLFHDLEKQGFPVRRQVLIPLQYQDLTIDNGYRIDLLVGDRVVVELKVVEAILPVHRAAAELFAPRRVQARLFIEFSCRAYARRHCQDGERSVTNCALSGSSTTSAVKGFLYA